MGLITKLQNWFRKRLQPERGSTSPRQQFWADNYAKLILREGGAVSEETLTNARQLGLDVEALIAEHERRKAASWSIEFSLDLADVEGGDPQLTEKLKQAGIPVREIQTHGCQLSVSVAGLYNRIELPDKSMPMNEIVVLGLAAIHQRYAEIPDEFPANRYPNGVRDWELTSFRWIEDSQDFHLGGQWKAEARNRLPSKLRPESAVDLRRTPPAGKKLVSALPVPDLEQITLNVWRWPDGKHVVMDVFASEASSPPPHQSPHPEQPDTLRLTFPSDDLPPLEWKLDWYRARTPAMDFLHQRCCRLLGKPTDWLVPYSRETLFEDYETTVPATDLRSSLRSGPMGPAPLPKGAEWPCCPHCGEPALFSQSVDVRDIGFADLLPGTTLVIFACNDCLEDGQWQNCSTVVWLGCEDKIELKDRGDTSPLMQRAQWYGPELIDHHDLPKDAQEDLDHMEKHSDATYCALPQSYGSKVGGVPAYLQQEDVFYDRNGNVMEYIAQISTPEHISAGGLGYVSYSAATGETYIDFQDT